MIAKMKYETKDIQIPDFGGLKPKMYLLIKENVKGDKKAKGINK